MNEFEYIKQKLSPLAPPNALNNDAFVYQENTVITKDIIIEGVHFLKGTRACDIAKKAIRVNLSDIASMGAKPYGYFLGLAINNTSPEWLNNFAEGLEEDNNEFSIKLLGGDTTTHNGPSVISITVLGLIEKGKELTRSGAKVGDSVYVSGTIGDAALGLLTYSNFALHNFKALQKKYIIPTPQIALGRQLCGIASSCIDISDGLIQDASNICEASKIGMEIYIDKIPFSEEVNSIVNSDNKYLEIAISGGDDYQLLFTTLNEFADKNVTKVGKIIPEQKLRFIDKNGSEVNFSQLGYKHF